MGLRKFSWGLFAPKPPLNVSRREAAIVGEENSKPTLRSQMRNPYFWAGMVVGITWIAVFVWLSIDLGWPDNYGFHCHGKGCLFVEIWHSPTLLKHNRLKEFALFMCVWTLPALVLGVWAWVGWKKLKNKHLNFSLFDDNPPPP
jgi:hypothetical protein